MQTKVASYSIDELKKEIQNWLSSWACQLLFNELDTKLRPHFGEFVKILGDEGNWKQIRKVRSGPVNEIWKRVFECTGVAKDVHEAVTCEILLDNNEKRVITYWFHAKPTPLLPAKTDSVTRTRDYRLAGRYDGGWYYNNAPVVPDNVRDMRNATPEGERIRILKPEEVPSAKTKQ